jgi:hypothetical protein
MESGFSNSEASDVRLYIAEPETRLETLGKKSEARAGEKQTLNAQRPTSKLQKSD